MKNAVLVLDSGSSSIKFAVFARGPDRGLERVYRGEIEGIGNAPRFRARDAVGEEIPSRVPLVADEKFTHDHALAFLLAWPREHAGEYHVVAAGHRVVHGGERFAAPVLLDADVIARLEELIPLAPLHQSNNLALIKAHRG